MPEIPKPKGYGSFEVEPFDAYRARLPAEFNGVPDPVIETWIHRHWSDFQAWLPLRKRLAAPPMKRMDFVLLV
jgi:hypothetical protein